MGLYCLGNVDLAWHALHNNITKAFLRLDFEKFILTIEARQACTQMTKCDNRSGIVINAPS